MARVDIAEPRAKIQCPHSGLDSLGDVNDPLARLDSHDGVLEHDDPL